MHRVIQRALAAADGFEPRSLPLAVCRSVLAFAELTALLFTPDHDLFTYEPGLAGGMHCSGVRGYSLWCMAGSGSDDLTFSRIVAMAVLVAVICGFRPKWTCIPHWYVAFSFANAITQPNGGDAVVGVATLLLIPILLGDDRAWHWTRPNTPLPPAMRGSAYAAWLAIRCQIAVIYLDAAVSKLAVPQWRDGQAMHTIFTDPNYGLPSVIRDPLGSVLQSGGVVAFITWSVMALELTVAICALCRARARKLGIWPAVLLHAAIIVAMGLFSFGLTMIALVLVLRIDGRPAAVQISSTTVQRIAKPVEEPCH
jgi:antimicrobial peptide system SdpB family protein